MTPMLMQAGKKKWTALVWRLGVFGIFPSLLFLRNSCKVAALAEKPFPKDLLPPTSIFSPVINLLNCGNRCHFKKPIVCSKLLFRSPGVKYVGKVTRLRQNYHGRWMK